MGSKHIRSNAKLMARVNCMVLRQFTFHECSMFMQESKWQKDRFMVYRETLHFLHNYTILLHGLKPRKAFLKTSVILGSVHISFSAVIWSYCVISICSLKLSSVCFNLGETMGFLYSVLGMCPFLKHGLLIASVSTHAHS